MSTQPSRFRTKPVVVEVEAMQFTRVAWREMDVFVGADEEYRSEGNCVCGNWEHESGEAELKDDGNSWVALKTRKGSVTAFLGDWIIKGVDGEFDIRKPAIFAATYEPVEAGVSLPGDTTK